MHSPRVWTHIESPRRTCFEVALRWISLPLLLPAAMEANLGMEERRPYKARVINGHPNVEDLIAVLFRAGCVRKLD
jgi:hypothetical protein